MTGLLGGSGPVMLYPLERDKSSPKQENKNENRLRKEPLSQTNETQIQTQFGSSNLRKK